MEVLIYIDSGVNISPGLVQAYVFWLLLPFLIVLPYRSWGIIAIPDPHHEWGSTGYPRLPA